MPRSATHSVALYAALALYLGLATTTVRATGVVGEVAIAWALPTPPTVLTHLDPPDESVHRAGPLEARPARPTESLVLGSVRLPLAVNAYTGGPPDWPARGARAIASALTTNPMRAFGAGTAANVLLGALLLVLAHRFLRFHGTATAAGAAALLIASDWSFVFYRKVLGGTEILLQAAALLVLWSLWSRRWKGGTHGTVAIAVGIGLGLLAKATFIATLAAYAVAAILTRWDRSAMRPPDRVHRGLVIIIPLVLVSPLLLTTIHHALLPASIVSHDTLAMQFGRIGGGGASARESVANLLAFLGHPLATFQAAWQCASVATFSPLRTVGFALALGGIALEWRHRTVSPSAALLRYLSLAVPFQLAFLFLANRDLHHLAQAAVPLALLVALAADRLAATVSPPRSTLRALTTLALIAPLVIGGVQELRQTDAIVRSCRSPSFTEAGQDALITMLRRNHVRRLVTTSYEAYGMIEARAPDIVVIDAWGAMSNGERVLPALLRVASGGHYLSMKGSAPFIYDWRPEHVPGEIDAISDGESNWAELFRVE